MFAKRQQRIFSLEIQHVSRYIVLLTGLGNAKCIILYYLNLTGCTCIVNVKTLWGLPWILQNHVPN